MSKTSIVAVIAASLLFAATAASELTDEQKKEAQALIEQFIATEFDARQEAVEKLVAMGPDVGPLLREAMEKSKDEEVRFRCEMTLRAIAGRFGAEALGNEGETLVPAKAFGPSRITLNVADVTLGDVLAELATQSGNTPLKPPADLAGLRVTLALEAVTYWEALDALAHKAGLTYGHVGQSQLRSVPGAVLLSASSGPVAVRVDSVYLTRNHRASNPSAHCQLLVNYLWEDRLPVVAGQIVFTGVTTPGQQLLKIVNPGWTDVMAGVGFAERSGGTAVLTVSDPPAGLDELSEVSGILMLRHGIGTQRVRVDDALSGENPVGRADDLVVQVRRVERQPRLVNLSLAITDREGRDVPAANVPARYGFRLVSPDGRTVEGTLAGRGVDTTRVMFRNVPDAEGRWTLIYDAPRTVAAVEYPFTIAHIPLR